MAYTANETIGSKYNRGADITDIAKAVRKDIKDEFPELKVSVTTERYAGGRSLNVTVKESPVPLNNPAYDSDFVWGIRVGKINSWTPEDEIKRRYYTERGKHVEDRLKEIVLDYNRDDSDSMVDYFDRDFYEHINIKC